MNRGANKAWPRVAAIRAVSLLCCLTALPQQPDQKKLKQPGETSGKGYTVSEVIQTVQAETDGLALKLSAGDKKSAKDREKVRLAPPAAQPRLGRTFLEASNDRAVTRALLEKVHGLLDQAQAPGNEAVRGQLVQAAKTMSRVAEQVHEQTLPHNDLLDDLARRAAQAQSAAAETNNERSSAAVDVFEGRRRMGGGVFLDEAATMPVPASEVASAEYDLGDGRFVLHRNGGGTLRLPPMNQDVTRVVVRCLYQQPGKEISMSLGIIPGGDGTVKPGTTADRESVLFGCHDLINTALGLTMMNSDELLGRIWAGKNLPGEDLTRLYHHASLGQMMLDHPMMQPNLPGGDHYAMRIWISPEAVVGRQQGGEIVFDAVAMHLYTQTLKVHGTQAFVEGTSEIYPNPAADIFATYFRERFDSFAHLPLGTDEETGATMRPFEALREAAKVAGVVLWLRNSGVRMDTGWAFAAAPARVLTPRHVFRPEPGTVDKAVAPPAVIYNQYGPSRILANGGMVFRCTYDSSGRFVSLESVP